jgi:Mlc titration factor MtfA (ptsG expression regulator)
MFPPLSQLLIGLIGATVLAAVLGIALWPSIVAWRRGRVRRQPFPAKWRAALKRHVPYVYLLPADLQLQLKKRIQVFIAEKPFIGCAGLEVTDEMRVVVAAQACMLLLNRATDNFANLRQVLMYPGAFVVDRALPQAGGVLRDERHVLAGESWSQGQVLLSWDDVLAGAATVDDGRNVVMHEFAHQLDQADGHANGAPPLPRGADSKRWRRVFDAEYNRLHRQLAQGESPLLGSYAATNPAEFFAVATEVFFEQPRLLADDSPALFAELAAFYCVNPLTW